MVVLPCHGIGRWGTRLGLFRCGSFCRGPAGLRGLAAAAESERIFGDVFGDRASGGDVGSGTDANGSDEGGVGADEGSIADDGLVLVDAVVVAGDGSRAYIDSLADDGVAEIVQVVGFGTFAEGHFFGLDEVADVGVLADTAFGAEMRVRTEDGAVTDFGAVEDAAVAYGDSVTEGRLLNDGVGADAAFRADAGCAE